MARRRKRIVDLVRDETFLARKDEHLLGVPVALPWRRLDRLRLEFRAADGRDERREIALGLERGLRELGAAHYLGELQAELRRLGPPDTYRQLSRFASWGFRHYAGPEAGKPFRFVRFQQEFLKEFWRRDDHGRRVYTVGLLMIPKGNGKTPLAAVLGTHALVSETDAPEVYNLAGAKDQAALCQQFASKNITGGPLAAWLEVSSLIRCDAHHGEYEILSSDGDLHAGVNPSAAIVDEWWQFLHRKQREGYNSLAKALHKRSGRSWLLAISTAGFNKASQLGETYDAVMADPRIERRRGGYLHVLRDEEAGLLFWSYGVPDDLDPDIEDEKVIRACNPAPWLAPRDLVKELHRHDTHELDWRRLHLNQWTKSQEAWLPAGRWKALGSETEIPRGADIYVAVDAAKKYDTTACAWAYKDESGRIVLRAKVWSARREADHHVFVPGGRIRNELVESFIADELAEEYMVREVVYDPRYFDTQGEHLADRGLIVGEFPQASAAMADAYQHFYEAAINGTITHDQHDSVFAAHVEAAAAVLTENGWRVYKLRSTNPIDALVAAAMARERASRDSGDGGYLPDTRTYCVCGHLEAGHAAGACSQPGCPCIDYEAAE